MSTIVHNTVARVLTQSWRHAKKRKSPIHVMTKRNMQREHDNGHGGVAMEMRGHGHDGQTRAKVGAPGKRGARTTLHAGYDDVLQLERELRSLPPPKPQQKLTKMAAVRMLLPAIEEARKNGYTLSEVARIMTERGIPMTASILGQMMSKARREERTGMMPTRGRGRPRKVKSEDSPVAAKGAHESRGETLEVEDDL